MSKAIARFALLLICCLVPATSHATVSRTKIISAAKCRSVYLGTSAPFSDWIYFDNSGNLFDYLGQYDVLGGTTKNTNSQAICDFGLNTDVVSVDSVDLIYGNTNSTAINEPQMTVVFTANHSGSWSATNAGGCIGTSASSSLTNILSCSWTTGQSFSVAGYSNWGAYAVINWVPDACDVEFGCYKFPAVYRLQVHYTTST